MEVAPSEQSLPFGRYVIRQRLAQGGMAEVFLAIAVGADGFEKPVVVKRLLPKFAGRTDVARLLSAEAKLMTRLIHPNIVQVIDFGRGDKDDYFLVMELVTGTDVGRFCRSHSARRKRMPQPLALFITGQVLRGLAYAHATASAGGQRLVHRDISPGNILLSTFGEVKVTDFGVALVASSTGAYSPDGYLVGNPSYMAPEQLERGQVDERADVYGAGAVLFHMLTGSPHQRRPGASVDSLADLSPHSRVELARVANPELVKIVERALARQAEDRFADAREMTRCIEQLAASGDSIATADTLADAVSELVQVEPSGARPVVVLSANENEGVWSGTELCKLAEGEGAEGFTLRVQKGSVSTATPDAPSPAKSDHPRRRLARWALLAAAATAMAGWLVLRFHHRDLRSLTGSSLSGAETSEVPGAPSIPAPTAEGPFQGVSQGVAVPAGPGEATFDSPGQSSPPAPRSEQHREHGTRLRHPKEPAKEEALQAHGQEPAAAWCHGQIHLYAKHGWLLSGGPSVVQAPGRYEWPCGTYTLRATSRTDAKETRSVTVTIRETSPDVVDLR